MGGGRCAQSVCGVQTERREREAGTFVQGGFLPGFTFGGSPRGSGHGNAAIGDPPPPEQRGTRAEGVQPVGEGGHGQQRPAMLCQLGARGGARGGGGCPAKRPAKSKCRILSGPT